MVSPSATPITLPDQAQAGQGRRRKQTTASQIIEKAFFIASQPSRLSLRATKFSKTPVAKAVPAIASLLGHSVFRNRQFRYEFFVFQIAHFPALHLLSLPLPHIILICSSYRDKLNSPLLQWNKYE